VATPIRAREPSASGRPERGALARVASVHATLGGHTVLKLYDAPRCPYCARARIALVEKGLEYETVVIDLDERPQFIKDVNPPEGRVPVLEEDGFLLPESRVIMRYLDERHPEPPLLPQGLGERALVDFVIERFDRDLGTPYYRLYFDRPGSSREEVEACLASLDSKLAATSFLAGETFTLADIAYVPWVLRAETRLGLDVRQFASLAAWVDRLAERPSVAAELEVVAAL
jgi:glutathione S-transferase